MNHADFLAEGDGAGLLVAGVYLRRALRVRQVPGKGRGVFAREVIERGALIERSPVLLIPDLDRKRVDPTIVFTYVFMWEAGTTEQDLYSGVGKAAVALGLTSLLNHSHRPNADFVRHFDELTIDLVALRDIQCDEEITIDYQMDLWFDPA